MGGGLLERIHDLVEMPLRVGLVDGVPNCLSGKHDLAVDYGGRLAVAGAEIESDPATVKVPPQRLAAGARRRNVACEDNFKGTSVNFFRP